MQGHRKGALDMCPGRTRCGLEPGRDKETGVGQRGINEGNTQESVAAWMVGVGQERRRVLPWLTPRSLTPTTDSSQ